MTRSVVNAITITSRCAIVVIEGSVKVQYVIKINPKARIIAAIVNLVLLRRHSSDERSCINEKMKELNSLHQTMEISAHSSV